MNPFNPVDPRNVARDIYRQQQEGTIHSSRGNVRGLLGGHSPEGFDYFFIGLFILLCAVALTTKGDSK